MPCLRNQGEAGEVASLVDDVVDGYALTAATAEDAAARCVFRRAVGDVFDALAPSFARSGLKLRRKAGNAEKGEFA